LQKVSAINHFIVDAQDTRVGMCLECGDDRFGAPHIVI